MSLLQFLSLCFHGAFMGSFLDFPSGAADKKNLPTNAGNTRDASSIPGSGRSPGGENGNQLQYSHLGNPMHRGA